MNKNIVNLKPCGPAVFEAASLHEIKRDKALSFYWAQPTVTPGVSLFKSLSLNCRFPFIHWSVTTL